jgi:hypothetical protein
MNQIFTLIIGALFLIAVAGFVVFLVPNQPQENTEVPVEETAVEYRNIDHGYALSYPSDLSLLEYTPDMATIGYPIEGGITGVADVRVALVIGESGESFTDAAARELADLCAADGPESSFACTGVSRIAPFRAKSGAMGFEIYLNGTLTERTASTTTTIEKGPYYAFVLNSSATATKVLIVHAPLNLSAAESSAERIRAIASTVVLP